MRPTLAFVLLLSVLGCHTTITGAACLSDENCPREQFCDLDLLCHPGTSANGHLTGIRILGAEDGLIPKGESRALRVSATLSSGTVRDVTAQALWQVADPTVVSFGTGPAVNVLTALNEGSSRVTAMLGPFADATTFAVINAELLAIELKATQSTLAKGTRERFTAIGVYSDGTREDVSSLVTWTSTDPTVAALVDVPGSYGLVEAHTHGTTDIIAERNGIAGSASLSVSDASLIRLDLTPSLLTLARGTSQPLSAVGTFSDETTQDLTTSAVWSSGAPAVASFTHPDVPNDVVAHASGMANVFATVLGVTATVLVTVTDANLLALELTPPLATLAAGTSKTFVAVGRFSDGSTQDLTSSSTWAESDDGAPQNPRATVNHGLVRAWGSGSATLHALQTDDVGGVLHAAAQLTLTNATLTRVQLAVPLAAVAKGTREALTVSGIFSDGSVQDLTSSASFDSSDSTVCSFSFGSAGTLSALGGGSAQLRARAGTLTSDAVLVSVSNARPFALQIIPGASALAVGTTVHLAAFARFSDDSVQDVTELSTWSVTAPVAPGTPSVTVSNAVGGHGRVAAQTLGDSTVTASLGSVTATAALAVGAVSLSRIQVTPPSPYLAVGSVAALGATGLYSNGSVRDLTADVTWQVDAPGTAAVSNADGVEGVLTALAAGTTQVTATLGALSGATPVTVSEASRVQLRVSPSSSTCPVGAEQSFTAEEALADGTSVEATSSVGWSAAPLPVSALGVVSGIRATTATVTAQRGGLSGSASLMVTDSPLVSLTLSAANVSMLVGTSQPFTATAGYGDGSTGDVTGVALWDVSNIGGPGLPVASVPWAGPARGWVTGLNGGQALVQASFGGKSGSTPVAVHDSPVTALKLLPSNSSLPRGRGLRLTAIATLADSSIVDVSSRVTFSESDGSGGGSPVATVSNAGSSRGLVRASSLGMATLTTTYVDPVSGSRVANAALTVTDAVLETLQLNPAATIHLSLAGNHTIPFNAAGGRSDHGSSDVSTSSSWTSSSAGVAAFNAADPPGLLRAAAVGQTQVRASLGSVTSAPVTVVVDP